MRDASHRAFEWKCQRGLLSPDYQSARVEREGADYAKGA